MVFQSSKRELTKAQTLAFQNPEKWFDFGQQAELALITESTCLSNVRLLSKHTLRSVPAWLRWVISRVGHHNQASTGTNSTIPLEPFGFFIYDS